MTSPRYYTLDPAHTDPARLKKEREKAKKLKDTQWWRTLLNQGVCHYCENRFEPKQLTMDHIVPLARGGSSTQGNIVPSCRDCNRDKKLDTPVDTLFDQLEREKQDSQSAWGSEQTEFFFELTPDRVLDAVEASGFRVTGFCQALNSFENRVYEVELDAESLEADPSYIKGSHRSESRRIAKFYRPGRWNEKQILEEHQFLFDLNADEVPAVAPIPFPDGKTLRKTPDGAIFYSLFKKSGGRAPDEFTTEQLQQIGRLLARMHATGARGNWRQGHARIELNSDTYGRSALKALKTVPFIPSSLYGKLEAVINAILEEGDLVFQSALYREQRQRIHGDCHFGNLLWNPQGAFFLDFDDMVIGPPVQDIWLLLPGRDSETRMQREILLEAYEEMRAFDRRTLRWIELLRSLRMIHFSAWIGKRWEDPAFPKAFPQYETPRYWEQLSIDLHEQLNLIREEGHSFE